MSNPPEHDNERRARFAATLEAIRAASAADIPAPTITDTDLEALIKIARQIPQS
jgi:hypothetical protein